MIIYDTNKIENTVFSKPLIIMLPFAGGSAFSYRDLCVKLEEKYDILCPELPGRGSLTGEKLLDSIEAMSDYVFANWIKPIHIANSYVIYGHSMGGLLAYSILKKIEKSKKNLPKHIVISGRAAPSVSRNRNWHQLSSTDFWNNLSEMGGVPEVLLSSIELRDYFEDIIRADFKAVETYMYSKPEKKSEIPITILYGSKEDFEMKSLESWKDETTQNVTFIKMEGTHFFIYDHSNEISELLELALK